MDPGTDPQPEAGKTPEAATDHSLLQRYRGGSQDAATEIYLRYAQRLRGLAQAEISAGLARKVEVEDVVQSVFGSFFRGVNNALYDVPAGAELWKLLLVIALHKIRNKGNYHHAARRDLRRSAGGDEAEALAQAAAGQDTAALAFLQLVIDEALARMPAQQKQMVELRMEGYEILEIAEKTGRSRRSVERLLQHARGQLGTFLEEGSQNT